MLFSEYKMSLNTPSLFQRTISPSMLPVMKHPSSTYLNRSLVPSCIQSLNKLGSQHTQDTMKTTHATTASKASTTTVTADSSKTSGAANRPLEGCHIALHGRMNLGQNGVRKLINQLGGKYTSSTAVKKCTHLIASRNGYTSPRNNQLKTARQNNIHIISEDWLLETERLQKRALETPYLWSKIVEKELKDGKVPDTKSKKRTASDEAVATSKETDHGIKTATPNKKPKDVKIKTETSTNTQPLSDQFIKVPGTLVPVDPCAAHCVGHTVYIDPTTGLIHDASLVHVSTSLNYNKYAIIQVHLRTTDNAYFTWHRQGRVGENGTSEFNGDGTLASALAEYERLFKSKTGLEWSNRSDKPNKGMYTFVERNYHVSSTVAGTAPNPTSNQVVNPPSKLDKRVKQFLDVIFDQNTMNKTLISFKYDSNKTPLGLLSDKNILQGVARLQELSELFENPKTAYTKFSMQVSEAIAHLSDAYYSIIPHDFGSQRPPVMRNRFMLAREMELLESLSNMKAALKLKNFDHKNLHPADYCFYSLGLEEMTPLDSTTQEYQLLEKYLYCHSYCGSLRNFQIIDIFRIRRWGEASRFENSQFFRMPSNRRLLWHGTRAANLVSILRDGLSKGPPGISPNVGMFGQGTYFADSAEKSISYGGNGLLLLSEVELGTNPLELLARDTSGHLTVQKAGRYSIKAVGTVDPVNWVNAGVVHPNLNQCQMPDLSAGYRKVVPNYGYNYNEYVCYNDEQIQLRYLFRLK